MKTLVPLTNTSEHIFAIMNKVNFCATKMNENYKDLLKQIESTLFTAYHIGYKLASELIGVVDAMENIHDTFDVNNVNITELVAEMNPFHLKLFQYLSTVVEDKFSNQSEEMRKHYITVILFKAFKFFPTAPGVYMTYAMYKLYNNDSIYVDELQKHTKLDVINNRTRTTNIIAVISIITIVVIVLVAVMREPPKSDVDPATYKAVHDSPNSNAIE